MAAARPLLSSLRAVSTLIRRAPTIRTTTPRTFHTSTISFKPSTAVPNTATGPTLNPSLNQTPSEPFDPKNAAFLGEADSDDHFEAENVINPRPVESLDAGSSAYLGEAEHDGFETHKEIHYPTPQEALDATQSAFLGEADSDDNFEGHLAANPTDHGIEDASPSGFHGESGEQDQ